MYCIYEKKVESVSTKIFQKFFFNLRVNEDLKKMYVLTYGEKNVSQILGLASNFKKNLDY